MTRPVESMTVVSSQPEVLSVQSGKFSKMSTANFKTRMNEIAQKISSLATNAFNSIKQAFQNLSRSIQSLMNRISSFFKKEVTKTAEPVAEVTVPEVKETVVAPVVVAPVVAAPWYTAASLKAKALAVKNGVAKAAESAVTFSKNHKVAIATAASLALLAAAGYKYFFTAPSLMGLPNGLGHMADGFCPRVVRYPALKAAPIMPKGIFPVIPDGFCQKEIVEKQLVFTNTCAI